MNAPHEQTRLEELLAEQAALGLSAQDERELAALLAARPDVDHEEFERLAALIELGVGQRDEEPLPVALRAALARDAANWLPPSRFAPLVDAGFDWRRWSGWLAAAASLLLAFALWPTGRESRSTDLASLRDELARSPLTVRSQLTSGRFDSQAAGELLWDPVRQQGLMRLSGLPRNDPRRSQYQLWIFDRAQDDRFPIDGGVFDFNSNGEVLTPVRPALKVADPYMFAVTAERPGGVVVSEREQVALIGRVEPESP